MILKKVISGGQTGVDRAGLDSALQAGITIGGYCPKGRLSEDGSIPEIYPLEELPTSQYQARTEKNVTASDGTLIINKGELTNGTKLTYDFTVKYLKPCLIVQLDDNQTDPAQVVRWIEGQQIRVLNVAGPRESKHPDGIYQEAFHYLLRIIEALKSI
jgi:hypothetical protein